MTADAPWTCLTRVANGLDLHKVTGCDEAAALVRILADIAGSHDASRFPGANPCSLERSNFGLLRVKKYYVCEKTDGIRCLWLCCTWDGKNISAIVDRTLTVYLLPLQAIPTVMFQGSVVDCELAFNRCHQRWQLLAFDCNAVSGIRLLAAPFSDRMAALRRAMCPYAAHAADAVEVRVKKFLPACMFASYAQHEADIREEFDVDGLVLTPEDPPVVYGMHQALFKLKTKHTVDFLVGGDQWARDKAATSTVELAVFDSRQQRHVVVGRSRYPLATGAIAECTLAADGVWDLVCERKDKRSANGMLTYEKTLLNMREGITPQELLGVFASA